MTQTSLVHHEIRDAIRDLDLDLSGLVVLTEAANGVYSLTPLLACLAGAKKVIAVGADSLYGSFEDVSEGLVALSTEMGVASDVLRVMRKEEIGDYSQIDLVTNLGFVRPINQDMIDRLRVGCSISYMCEAWEYRESDLDLIACRNRGIKVAGVNEDHPTIDCFRETGLIALKEMIDAKISLPYSRVLVLSRDKFGPRICEALRGHCQSVSLVDNFGQLQSSLLVGFDVVIVADYNYEKIIIGKEGVISPEWLRPECTVIQYLGSNSVEDMNLAGIRFYPARSLGPRRMAQTLGDISIRAITRLYAGGLKVGELLATDEISPEWRDLMQPMNF